MTPAAPIAGHPPAKLPTLDAGRFVAALLVVLFHYSFLIVHFTGEAPFAMAFRSGHAGVEYFFVLSGFIIFYAHRKDLGQPRRVGAFFAKRAIRILPMLWLILIVWGSLRILLSAETTNGATGPVTLILDMLLLPHDGPSVLGVTWTLTRELVFYLIFSLCLLNRAAGAGALALWQAAVIACAVLRVPLGPWGAALFDVHNLGFGIGLLVALVGALASARRGVWTVAVGAALFVGLMVAEWHVGGPIDAEIRPLGRWLSPTLYSLAAGVVLLGLASYDAHGVRPERKAIRYLGGCSYILYLVHGPVGSLAMRLIERIHLELPTLVLFALLTLAAVAVALLLHIFVEQPILRWLRRREKRPGIATPDLRRADV